ncbi:hypothetical protein MRX96_042147 [Rhipicephalus microplus]
MHPTRRKANATLFSVIAQGCCLYRRWENDFEFDLKESELQCQVWANDHAVNRGDGPMLMRASSLFIEHRDDLKLQPHAYATTELAVEEGRPVGDPETGHTTEEHVYGQSLSGCASRSKRRQYAFEEKRQAKLCALGILSPTGRHLLLAERGNPDGHKSPNPHKSPEEVVAPTLSPDYVSPLGITNRHYPVTPNPAMKARDRKKKLCRLLVAAMVCVVLPVTAASAGALIYAYRSAVPTCESTGCHLFAKAFQASMDTIVDPCQDFGRYVCGRYAHLRNLSVIEAAAQSYRDEVAAPTRNDSLIGTGQNALQKSWRFYKFCEDVVDDHTDNTAYVLRSMFDCRLSWPDPSPTGVDLLQVIGCLSTKMAWPSIAYLQVDSVAKDVVTMNPSPYTQEILRRVQEINVTAYEVFFNAAVEHFRQPDSDTYAINFTAIHNLEMEYAGRVGEEAGPLVYYNQELSWVKSIVRTLRRAVPDHVQRYAELRLATNCEHFVHFFSHRVIFPQREDELMLGWHVVLQVAALTNSELATLFHELIGGSKEPIWKHKSSVRYCGRIPLRMLCRYGAFASSFAASTAVHYTHMGGGGGLPRTFAEIELCARRDGRSQPQLFDLIGVSSVEAAFIICEAHSTHNQWDDLRLPGMKWLTPSQTFYVSFCYLRCARDLQKVKCDLALQWHEPFKSTFACAPSSATGSHHSCLMFRTSVGS